MFLVFLTPILMGLALLQTSGGSMTDGHWTMSTDSIVSGGASFWVLATFDNPTATVNTSLATDYNPNKITVIAQRDGNPTGSASISVPVQYYFCGKYTGTQSGLPTSVSYSIAKTERSVASTSGTSTTGNSASASTTNTSVQTTACPQSLSPAPYSNTVSGNVGGGAWQARPDGSYTFNYFAFSNTLAAACNLGQVGRFSGAGGTAYVSWSLGSAVASH